MSQWNIAAKSKDEQDKVNVDLAVSGVVYYPEWSEQLPRAFDPRYIEMEEASKK